MKNRPFSRILKSPLAGVAAAALLTSSALVQTATAAPLVSIGDTVDIFFNGSVSTRYNTNIFNNASNKMDDFVFVISPGVEISAGRTENANITLIFREDFMRYNRASKLNNDLSNLFIDGFYKTGPATIASGFSYYQTQQNTGDINQPNNLVLRDIYNAYAELEYDITKKVVGDIGFDWKRTSFQSFQDVYHDRDVYTIPMDILYRVTPKIEAGLGYRYRYTSVDNTTTGTPGTDYQDHFYNVVVRGDLLTKLYATINIGAQTRDRTGGGAGTETTFATDGSLTWEATPKTTVAATFGRDFGTAGVGSTIIRTGGDVTASYAFSDFIQTSATFGYTENDYSGTNRTDKTTVTGANVSYTPNSYLRFGAGYTYQNNDSDVSPFQSHIVSLSASLRY